jgi:uncharacterized membrane protein YjjP (DUF1212 family)
MIATSVVGTRWYVLCEDMLYTLSAIAAVVAGLVIHCAVCAVVKEKLASGSSFMKAGEKLMLVLM